MSHIHFVSTKEYYKRLIQLGEKKNFVFNVGSLGVENSKKLKFWYELKLYINLVRQQGIEFYS